MDDVTGPIAYAKAEELEILEALKRLRKEVKEERNAKARAEGGSEIQGTFVGILRALGNAMQNEHGKFGER